MSAPKPERKREWPKMARGPLGNIARFACAGDVPAGWTVEGQTEPRHKPPIPPVVESGETLAELRARYAQAMGKNASPRWDADTIRQKLEAE